MSTKTQVKDIDWTNFNKLLIVISTQADLKEITWGKGKVWVTDEPSLRKLRIHKSKVQKNLDNLCSWATSARPQNDMLYVSRALYRQYQRELSAVTESIEMLSEYLNREETSDA